MFMAMCRSTLRNAIESHPQDPHVALNLANDRILGETRTDMFVTVFLGVLDPVTGLLRYCNAGHNPPFVRAQNGDVARLDRTGMALGVVVEGEWSLAQTTMSPGAIMLMYTDGVTEAQNTERQLFDEERLLSTLAANAGGTSHDIERAIFDAVTSFAGEAPQFDDMTCVVVRRAA